MLELFICWTVLAIVIGMAASSRGRWGFGWFLLSMLLSPVLAGLLLLLFAPQANSAPADADRPNAWTHVRCPDCRELVRKDARKCKHCGTALLPQ